MSWLKEFEGYTFEKRLEKAILQRRIKEVQRMQHKHVWETVLVSVLDRKKTILGQGFNKPSDLILDNFGVWLAGLIRNPVVAGLSVTLTRDTGATTTASVWSTAVNTFNTHGSQAIGTNLRIGSGSTPVARNNYTIETPFGTAPENTYFGSGAGSYALGYVTFSAGITAGGSGTIRETGFFGFWYNATGTTTNFMLFHDLISPVQPFTAGQSIVVSYSITI